MSDHDHTATVAPANVEPNIIERASSAPSPIVILPSRAEDGKSVYSERSVTIVKELRAAGAEACYLDPPDRRVFEVKKSGLEVALISLIIGIASSAAWDGIKLLLRRTPTRQLAVTYVELEKEGARRGEAWTATGDTEGVLSAIDRLRASRSDQ